MTVRQLISKLEKMPQDMEVYDYGSFEKEEEKDVFIDYMYINENETEDVVFI